MTETKDTGQTEQGTVSDETGLNGLTCCDLLCDSVICGDNVTVMREWPYECIDLVVTSPPYDNLRTYGGHEWDFEGVAEQLTRCLKPGGVIVWVTYDESVDAEESLSSMRQALHFKDVCGLSVHDTMIYQKENYPPQTAHGRYDQCWEYMFVIRKEKIKSWNPIKDRRNAKFGQTYKTGGGRNPNGSIRDTKLFTPKEFGQRSNVWKYPVGGDGNDHPASMPEKLASDLVQSWSNPGDIVLDPFAGSGTTLKAAKELNRRYIGIEINPEYVEMCNNRTAQEVLPLFTA